MCRRYSRVLLLMVGGLSCFAPRLSTAYEAEVHQQLTFIAARQFNRCMELQQQPRMSALDTRHIVKANAGQADANMFVRMFRWPYYNRADQQNRTSLWLIDTRFHDHFDALVERTRDDGRRRQSLRNLGRLINYVQDVTSPAHAVPVFTGRWWRFSMGDKFDRFRPRAEALRSRIERRCDVLLVPATDFKQLLAQTAADTLQAVQAPIDGFPATWESYWQLADEADEFGEYGRAGNSFGERTEFRCGEDERCLLLESDPLYAEFAMERHLAAIIATMRAMHLFQRDEA